MNRIKRNRLALLGAVTVGVLGFFGYLGVFGPDSFVFRTEIRRGNTIVASIEQYRSQHQQLPNSLSEAGLNAPDVDRYFYEKCTDSRYVVWFGTTLGESMTYDSSPREWRGLNVSCK